MMSGSDIEPCKAVEKELRDCWSRLLRAYSRQHGDNCTYLMKRLTYRSYTLQRCFHLAHSSGKSFIFPCTPLSSIRLFEYALMTTRLTPLRCRMLVTTHHGFASHTYLTWSARATRLIWDTPHLDLPASARLLDTTRITKKRSSRYTGSGPSGQFDFWLIFPSSLGRLPRPRRSLSTASIFVIVLVVIFIIVASPITTIHAISGIRITRSWPLVPSRAAFV